MSDNDSKETLIAQELRQEDQKLSEKNFDLLLNAANEGVWEANLINNTVWWNDAYHRKYGRPDNSNDSWDWWIERIHDDDRKRVSASLLAIASSKNESNNYWNEKYSFQLPDGSYVHIDDRAYVIRDQNNNATRIIGIMLDISQQAKLEKDFEKYTQQIAHTSRINIMGEMAANIVHEINQPLTAISLHVDSCLDILKSDGEHRDACIESMQEMKAASIRAKNIIDNIRRFSQIEPQKHSKVSINELITNTIKFFKLSKQSGPVKFHTNFAKDSKKIEADKTQIEQALINLMQNSIDAMAAESNNKILTIKTSMIDKQFIKITITDTGTGVKAEHEENIFEPFFTTKESGLGMGLAISQRIIENHGGEMWLESKPNNGAIFHFTLPTCNEPCNDN